MHKHQKLCASVGASISAMILMICATSCVTSPDVIFVDTTQDVVRLADDVEGHIFYRDGSGKWIRSNNKVKLPAGWYAGGLPAEE
jgi:hypothetical protein